VLHNFYPCPLLFHHLFPDSRLSPASSPNRGCTNDLPLLVPLIFLGPGVHHTHFCIAVSRHCWYAHGPVLGFFFERLSSSRILPGEEDSLERTFQPFPPSPLSKRHPSRPFQYRQWSESTLPYLPHPPACSGAPLHSDSLCVSKRIKPVHFICPHQVAAQPL